MCSGVAEPDDFPSDLLTPGKLADAELQFHTGILAGLKLLGLAIWERRTGSGRNVTFPARGRASRVEDGA
jgi:hypothetical protein